MNGGFGSGSETLDGTANQQAGGQAGGQAGPAPPGYYYINRQVNLLIQNFITRW